jgi:hypothetical protein
MFFLLVVVFNLFGYQLVIFYFQHQNQLAIERKVDRIDYKENDLISIKTRLNLPYYSGSTTFERVYGSILIAGIEYEYVKRRVYHDTLELLCLPNRAKTKMHEVTNEFAKFSADGEASTPSKKNTVLKLVLPEFCQDAPFTEGALSPAVLSYFTPANPGATDGQYRQQEKPPRSMLT